jgi:hypothetical protein
MREISEVFFHPDEYSWLSDKPPEYLDAPFYRLWTLKEAWSKLPGENFIDSLKQTNFSPTGGLPPDHWGWTGTPFRNVSLSIIIRGQSTPPTLWIPHEKEEFQMMDCSLGSVPGVSS